MPKTLKELNEEAQISEMICNFAKNTDQQLDLEDDDRTNFIAAGIDDGSFRKKGKKYPADTETVTVLEDIRKGEGVSLYVKERNDTVAFAKDENGRFFAESAAVGMKEQLSAVKKQLDNLGTTLRDSPEFKNMYDELNKLSPKLNDMNNCGELQKCMEPLAKAADNYYYAKLEQKHNGRRAARFDCAREIKEIMRCLEKHMLYRKPADRTPEEKMSRMKTDVAAKCYKLHQLSKAGSIGNKEEREAELKKIRTAADYRKNFYKNVGKIIKGRKDMLPQEIALDVKRTQLAVGEKTYEELRQIRSADKKGVAEAMAAPAKRAELKQTEPDKEKQFRQPEYKVPGLGIGPRM